MMRPLHVSACLIGLSLLFAAHAATEEARGGSAMSSSEITTLQQRLADAGCYGGAINGQPTPALQNAIRACPSQAPILRIETGTHAATIWGIDADAQCRIIATTSDDKTTRIWSGADGRLLRILRRPIGEANGGKGRTVAVSPNGRYVATAGWDVRQETQGSFIYVFDALRGDVVARLGGFIDVIIGLAFSDDGRWLAASGVNRDGVRVYDTSQWQMVMRDTSYGFHTYGITFGPDGHLYTASFDGKLRRYGPGPTFAKERLIAAPGGRAPYRLSVDPAGQFVAVGYLDTSNISFLDAATLKFRFSAARKPAVDRGGFFALDWSKQGNSLFAGGSYQIAGLWKFPLLVFNRDGQQITEPLGISNNTIYNVRRCGDRFVVGDQTGFGFVSETGLISWRPSNAADMRAKLGDAFTVSRDATKVRFGLGYDPKRDANGDTAPIDPVVFDLGKGTLSEAPQPLADLAAPIVTGLPVNNWRNSPRPSYGGRAIPLRVNETVRSLAISPDRSGFVLGTAFRLRAYAQDGTERWEQQSPDDTWGVNVSADGRIVVAAYGDGTIRWHRWSDGKELLALFVNRETKTWVAWTPTGYYMASPGGEDLIGWHLNRGWNQAADFFPASRFRERFNRPDIVRLVLDTLDEDAAIKQANETAKIVADTRPLAERLPPIIRIAGPADGDHVQNNAVTLDYAVRSPSGKPVNRIDLLINGRPVKAFGVPIEAPVPDVESKGSIPVTLTQHVSEVGLIAWSGGLASQAAHMKVTWDGAPEATRKLYALVIGVSNYADPAMVLKYAAKDANDFAKVLQDQKGRYYADVETRVLADSAVTRANLIKGLEWLEQMATNPNDVSVLFLAGHGMTDEKQTYWFYTADANDDDVRVKGISQDELRKSLQGVQGKVLWFLDTCHAGAAGKRPRVDINVLANTVSASENGGIVVFASSTGRQVAVESGALGNGAFTKAVVEGIERGDAARRDGLITTSTLDSYVVSRVGELTDNQQTPVMQRPPEEPDFAIAAVAK